MLAGHLQHCKQTIWVRRGVQRRCSQACADISTSHVAPMHVTSKGTVTVKLAIIGHGESSGLQRGLRQACLTACIAHKA